MKKVEDKMEKNSKPLAVRAKEAEEQWLSAHGLTKGLHRKSNSKARWRRRFTECPKEPAANERHRRFCKKRLGKLGAASKVRRIDPSTGE